MESKLNSDIAGIVERIVQTARPEQVVLFGSAARGDGDKCSDVDLLVIQAEPFGRSRSRIAEIGRIERALGATPIPTDILIYSADEVERYRDAPNHIVCQALTEGLVVYARN